MEYTEVVCKVSPVHEFTEIIIAYLANLGYSMFEETDSGVKAYIESKNFDRKKLDTIAPMISNQHLKLEFTVNIPEKKNWNEEWEKNFEPVRIGDEIYVRADYHPSLPGIRIELIIHPRMAFGTGHHSTTSMMMEAMLEFKFSNKNILDMGYGTGILAILARKLGSLQVTAIDNDPNAVENAILNCRVNNAADIQVVEGDASTPGDQKFDIILANINRNIILEDIPLYRSNLVQNGLLLTSGYYVKDYESVAGRAAEYGFAPVKQLEKENWCQATFKLNN
jgi:ribosomal protein L11 methyltransferase